MNGCETALFYLNFNAHCVLIECHRLPLTVVFFVVDCIEFTFENIITPTCIRRLSSADDLRVDTVVVLGHPDCCTRNAQLFVEARFAGLPAKLLRLDARGSDPESILERRR